MPSSQGSVRAPDGTTRRPATAALALGALGVVFGDIGTSPIYTMSTVLGVGGQRLTPELVYGMTSTVLWSMVLVVTVLYVGILLRADHDGEGGLLALLTLVRRRIGDRPGRRSRAVGAVTVLAVVGAAMFLGDSVITPAISVLSAVEGLETVDPALSSAVVPGALGVLVVLFAVQRFGTGRIGRLFGPVMLCWFAVLTLLGLASLLRTPAALQALNPHWVVVLFLSHPGVGFAALGAVVLAVTGAEALYADLGHFGRRPITLAWVGAVLPALVVAYLGQAALALRDPGSRSVLFFSMVPSWALWPVVVLATLATVIASQAVISGAFTVVRQAARLDLLPGLRVVHTSPSVPGQIYVPAVNWLLAALVVTLVVTFRSSASLAAAYGLAVTVTITVTTSLYLVLHRVSPPEQDRWARVRARAAWGMLGVALAFLAANVPKLAAGGWLPVGLAAVLAVCMTTWWTGRRRIDDYRQEHERSLAALVREVNRPGSPVVRLPGGAVYLARRPRAAPMALGVMVEQARALQGAVLLVTLETDDRPVVPEDEQYVLDHLGPPDDGISHLVVRVGFQQGLDPGHLLPMAARLAGGELDGLDPGSVLYYVSEPVVVLSPESTSPRWRQRLYRAMDRLSPGPLDLLALPADRTVVVGRQVRL